MKRFIIPILSLLAAGCAAVSPELKTPPALALPAGAWSQEGADASRSSVARAEPPGVWRAATRTLVDPFATDRVGETAAPLVVGDVIFAAFSSREVVALSWDYSRVLWSRAMSGRVFSSPAAEGSTLFVADEEGYVAALDLATGDKRWSAKVPYPVLSPLGVEEGRLYVLDASGGFYCFNALDGSVRWKYGKTLARTGGFWRGTRSAVGAGRVYLGLGDGAVQALDADSGKPLWKAQVSDSKLFPDVLAGPAFADGVVYAGTREGPLAALDAATGEPFWKLQLGVIGGIAVGEDRLFVGTSEGELAAVAKADGARLWTAPADKGLVLAPVLAGSQVLAGSTEGAFAAYDARTGASGASLRTGTGGSAQPWAGDLGILLLSNVGVLYRVDRR